MAYDRTKGSLITKVGFDRDADSIKIGASPIATLHDPVNGDAYLIGYNHPCIIPGTIAMWDFSEKSTGILYDKSENGNNLAGTSIDSSLYKDTIFGAAYDFPGAADYFSIADNASLSPTKQITIEAIVFPDTLVATDVIIRKNSSYMFWFDSGGKIRGYMYDSSSEYSILGDTTLSTGKWHHVAFTYDGSYLKVFLNGKVDGVLAHSGGIDDTANPLWLGCRLGAPSDLFDGKMAAVRLCNRALQPHEFMHHWYFNTLVNGNFNSDGALLFDPQVSAFKARKIFTVQADWDSRGQMRSSNIIVNNIRSSDESFVPARNDFSKLHVLSSPLVDDRTVGCYILDGRLNEEGKVIDLSANANHATLNSLADADLLNSRFGRYYKLGGSADYISIPDDGVFSFGDGASDSPFSIEALVKIDDIVFLPILTKGVYNTDGEWQFFIDSSEELTLKLFDESVASCFIGRSAGQTPTEGNWVYCAATYSGNGASSGIKLYLEGLRVDDTDQNSGSYVAMEKLTHDVWIGRYDTSYANGQIAFVRISNVELTQDEVVNGANMLFCGNGSVQDLLLPKGE